MKNQVQVKIASELEAEALRVLRAIPELEVAVAASSEGVDGGVDAVVGYRGTATPVLIQFKQRMSSAQAHQLVAWAKARPDASVLLIAGEATASAREILGTAGIGYIDGLGNVQLELPGLLLRLTGSGRPPAPKPSARLSGKSGLVVQAMLLEPAKAWHVGDLADRSNVSTGLVHRVLTRLEEEGVVEPTGAGPTRTRTVTNPTALLDLWTEEHRDRSTRHRAYLLSQSSDQRTAALASALNEARIDYALTGAAAASIISPFVTAVPVTEIWISSRAAIGEVVDRTGATTVGDGPNVVFLQAKDDGPLAFREQRSDIWMANVFRLYLDLRHDPRRGIEQSDNLRREVIGF